MQKYMVMLDIISWHMCFFSRKPCGPGVSSSARGATWAQGHGHGHGHVSCASCNTGIPGTTGSMCCVLQYRHLLTFQPKASSDDPNTYSYHTWLLTTLTHILNSFQVPFLGLFWIVGGLRCSLSPAKHPQPTWAPGRDGQWFQTLIPCRQSQFRTGYSHAPVCPELVRADTSI